jgi:pimeloyl-ACP methyl ester carboxylesterase
LRILRNVLIVVFLATASTMALSWTWATWGQVDLTPEVRASLPGTFIATTDGMVSYELRGREDGPVVVLVHGLTTPKFVWDEHMDPLVAAGYRVLRFDLFGRGFSERPEASYDTAFYDRQLGDLLERLELTRPVSLVGYSLGGGISVHYAAGHPDDVGKLVLIAPLGFVGEPGTGARLFLAPGIGEWLAAVLTPAYASADIAAGVADGTAPRDMLERWEAQYRYRGYSEAVLSTARSFSVQEVDDAYRAVGRAGIPTHVLWGTEDRVVPFSGREPLQQAVPQAVVMPIEGAGHSVTFTRARDVNALLLEALASR